MSRAAMRMPAFGVPATNLRSREQSPTPRAAKHYLRLQVMDKPGVVADIAAILRDEAISIESLLQHGIGTTESVPVVITTHEVDPAAMRRAVDKIAKLAAVTARRAFCELKTEIIPREGRGNAHVPECKNQKYEDAMPAEDAYTDRNLALELARVSEAAALSASLLVGRGDEKQADQVAVNAMRRALNALDIDGTVVIGEGERDEAPMLYIGEKVGTGKGPKVDIALDPLEGTTITATRRPQCAGGRRDGRGGRFPACARRLYGQDRGRRRFAGSCRRSRYADREESEKSRQGEEGASLSDLQVCILDRPRHEELIAKMRETGARIMLIGDGDVSGVIATSQPDSGIDMYVGSGGAPEGVLAAAALQCIGGQMQGRLVVPQRRRKEPRRASAGIKDLNAQIRE